MERLKEDSEIIKSLLENDDEKIINYFPIVNFDLLIKFYSSNIEFDDESLIKLAEDMNYLNCGKLTEVLIKIKLKKVDYTILNTDLIREINELDNIQQIACGDSWVDISSIHVALRKDGTLISWNDYYHPITEGGIIYIICRDGNLIALKKEGILIIWGNDRCRYVKLPHCDYIAIACSHYHFLALRKDGSLTKWLNNSLNLEDKPQTLGNGEYISIAAGYKHLLALNKSGYITMWSVSDYDEINDFPRGNGFIAIASGFFHSVALREDGSLVIWGSNSRYQRRDFPRDNEYIAIACGAYHSIALKKDGSIVIWGDNGYRQRENFPIGETSFTAIACGDHHSVAFRKDGSVVTWGDLKFIN